MTRPSPWGGSEVFILKGFKSCVLEVRIPKELGVLFSEVRNLKGLSLMSGEWPFGVRSKRAVCGEQERV
jgi:hypothetical protein